MIHHSASKKLPAKFYRTECGNEPVREWLQDLEKHDKRVLGDDIRTVEYGWPVGMPTCRPMGRGLYEVRSNLNGGRSARILFCIADGRIWLLHAFFKKSQATPNCDLMLAMERKRKVECDQ